MARRRPPPPQATLDRVEFVLYDLRAQGIDGAAVAILAVALLLFGAGGASGQWAGLAAIGIAFIVVSGQKPLRELRFEMSRHRLRIGGAGSPLDIPAHRVEQVDSEGDAVIIRLIGPTEEITLRARGTEVQDVADRARLLDDGLAGQAVSDDRIASVRRALRPLRERGRD